MKELKVKLDTIDDVKNFVNVVNRYPFDCDITVGKYVVDAKSIMGLFSLDLTKVLTLTLHSDDTAAIEDEVKEFLA